MRPGGFAGSRAFSLSSRSLKPRIDPSRRTLLCSAGTRSCLRQGPRYILPWPQLDRGSTVAPPAHQPGASLDLVPSALDMFAGWVTWGATSDRAEHGPMFLIAGPSMAVGTCVSLFSEHRSR
jgi:hypothetical protein